MAILWTLRPKIVPIPKKQKTIIKPIHYCWINQFKQTKNTLILYPAPENSWIIIKLDWHLFKLSPLHIDYNSEDDYTTIVVWETHLAYVEHLFAAFIGLWITNIVIDIPDGELPIIDWSSKLYTQLILYAWIIEQSSNQLWIWFETEAILCSDIWEWIVHLCPSDNLSVITTDNRDNPLWLQSAIYSQDKSDYIKDFSTCRECLKKPVSKTQLYDWNNERHHQIHPYFQDCEWMISYSDTKIHWSLLFANESARHQVIDVLWCLQLLWMPIVWSFKLYKPTQSLLRQFIKKLYESIPKVDLLNYQKNNIVHWFIHTKK